MTRLHRCDGCGEDIKSCIYKIVPYWWELVEGHNLTIDEKSFCGFACIAKWVKAHPEAEDAVVRLNKERQGLVHAADLEGD